MTDLAIIGEAWGAEEERERTPFVGASGRLLTSMLADAGIRRADCFLTNVFNFRPPDNSLLALASDKASALPGYPQAVGSSRTVSSKKVWIHARYEPELARLADELVEENPNLILALGNTPLWALAGKVGITKLRGATFLSTHTASGFKVLPTYHPAAILRQWDLRPVASIDLMKAAKERDYADLRRPNRTLWIEPTLEDLGEFYHSHIAGCEVLSVDIETAGTQITCIGFAPRPDLGLVVPFLDTRRKGKSYWPTLGDELAAWRWVKETLERPEPKKLFQNGLYDISFLWRGYGIRTLGADEDTMLLHHALQPESKKGLEFLASVYCDNLPAWKSEYRGSQTIKED